MLELASQRGFRECAQHHVSAPGFPGNVEGAGFFDSLGRDAGLSERSELAPETELVPVLWSPRKSGVPEVSPASAATLLPPQRIGEVVDNSQLIDAKPLIPNHTFGTGTQKRCCQSRGDPPWCAMR